MSMGGTASAERPQKREKMDMVRSTRQMKSSDEKMAVTAVS